MGVYSAPKSGLSLTLLHVVLIVAAAASNFDDKLFKSSSVGDFDKFVKESKIIFQIIEILNCKKLINFLASQKRMGLFSSASKYLPVRNIRTYVR